MKATFFWNTVTPIRPHCESSCFQSQAGTTQASQSLEHGRQSPYAPVSWPGLCPPCPAFFPPPPRGLTSARPTGGFSGATPHDSQPPRHTRGLGMAGAMSWGPGGRAPWGEAGTGRPAEYLSGKPAARPPPNFHQGQCADTGKTTPPVHEGSRRAPLPASHRPHPKARGSPSELCVSNEVPRAGWHPFSIVR